MTNIDALGFIGTSLKNRSLSFFTGIAVSGLLIGCGEVTQSNHYEQPEPDEIEAVANRVYAWQMLHHPESSWNSDWLNAVLFRGVQAAAKSFQNEAYREKVRQWSEHNNWTIRKRNRNADDLASGLVYLELFEMYGRENMITDTRHTVDSLLQTSRRGRELWNWSDALFMAPPVIVKMAAIKNDKTDIDRLDRLLRDAVDYLLDPVHHLFFRDRRYFNRIDVAGNRIFWSRGNGWVAAGFVQILQLLPKEHESYDRYLQLYRQLMKSIVNLQPGDGLWRTSLLSPILYPEGESSGSALFCYALAWGMNEGILKGDRYRKSILKAWSGLRSNIDGEGRLGSVQSVASGPGNVDKENSEIFGTGVFLLAASEMYRWSVQEPGN